VADLDVRKELDLHYNVPKLVDRAVLNERGKCVSCKETRFVVALPLGHGVGETIDYCLLCLADAIDIPMGWRFRNNVLTGMATMLTGQEVRELRERRRGREGGSTPAAP